jgi:hypothetical protein
MQVFRTILDAHVIAPDGGQIVHADAVDQGDLRQIENYIAALTARIVDFPA